MEIQDLIARKLSGYPELVQKLARDTLLLATKYRERDVIEQVKSLLRAYIEEESEEK